MSHPTCRYELKTKLAGVIYFHRISDVRMTGTLRRNFNMFQELCGENAFKNVVIVTTMWDAVKPEIGATREVELKTKGIFFRPVIEKGGQMARHDNTVSSARDILHRILRNNPVPLRVQEELVDEKKNIDETGAGKELDRELNEQIRKHKEEVRKLEEEAKQAIKEKDEEMKKELEAEAKRRQDEAERLENDIKRMDSDFRDQKEKQEARLEKLQEEARQEAARIAAQHQEQIDKLNEAIRTNNTASEAEKARIRQEIERLTGEVRVLGDPEWNPLLDFATHAVLLVVNPPAFAASVVGRVAGGFLQALF